MQVAEQIRERQSDREPHAPGPERRVEFLSPPVDFQMADEWFEFAVEDHFWFQWRLRAICETLRGAVLAQPILEVGCGNGAARRQLERELACPIDGCDVNPAALRQAPRGRGQLYFYDVHQRRPEWLGHFGTVLLLDTLEHIREPVPFLKSVAYHLRPGGQLLITVPALQWLYSRYDEADGHAKRYGLSGLRDELRAAGFALQRHTYWGLSLVPVIAIRKLVLSFLPRERAIEVGFQPGSGLVDRFLRALMRVECSLWPRAPLGTSLVGLARVTESA